MKIDQVREPNLSKNSLTVLEKRYLKKNDSGWSGVANGSYTVSRKKKLKGDQ